MILSLERRRALTAKAQTYAANIGEAEGWLLNRGVSREVAAMFQLGVVPPGNENSGRLSIPYFTPAGVVQIKYRTMNGNPVKYLGEAGCGVHLYNAQVLINTADTVALTEGEFDAIAIQAYCGLPAVAYPGTETWKAQEHWRLCFADVAEVLVIADGDTQGRAAARRVAESIGSHARMIDMPDGHDSNSFIQAQGYRAFLARTQ